MTNAQILKDRIKLQCELQGKSMSKMLSELELGVNAINQINEKKGIGSFVLSNIANYLNVSTDYLLGRTDNPNPSTENNVTLSNDQNRLLQMYSLLSDMEKGEILGELKAMTANKRPIQTIRAVARSVDNRPPRLITGDFSDILDAPDISDKY